VRWLSLLSLNSRELTSHRNKRDFTLLHAPVSEELRKLCLGHRTGLGDLLPDIVNVSYVYIVVFCGSVEHNLAPVDLVAVLERWEVCSTVFVVGLKG
jgi:hypothetical protein